MSVAQRPRKKARGAGRGLYFSSKISDYQFKKILWCFACDLSATEASRQIRLSVNSINSIYMKLRVYFTEAGLFRDFYDPSLDEPDESYEFRLLDYHLKRIAANPDISPGVGASGS